ncbi:ribonuclease M5 [Desulfococcus sp.]|uniref:ribonuclease M5 n=1 Tax=Desulfococcus sp. TaxID=2025834 RepID=UPI00359386E3
MNIREVIVVEGKDDERAVKQAVDAEVILTSGYGITEETFRRIEFARLRKGVIVLTDPDRPGEQIRKRINDRVPGCKNAYLLQADAFRKNDIGIENAAPGAIREALEKARCVVETAADVFSREDLFEHGLLGGPDASRRREALGCILGIGYANGKQLLKRLNHYAIGREEFQRAAARLAEGKGA